MYRDVDQMSARECYQAAVAAVIPRPIAWVSTKSRDGVLNLAPYSFFSVASCQPLILSVTQITPRNLKDKDTLTNLEQTGECVVNIVDEACVEIMNASCEGFSPEVDEFKTLGIEEVESIKVAPPGVAMSPVRFECKLQQVIKLSEGAMGGSLMLLQVVAIHSADHCAQDQTIMTNSIKAVGKMGGDSYCNTTQGFDLSRP